MNGSRNRRETPPLPFADQVQGLQQRGGRLWLKVPDHEVPIAVTIHYLRPLTARSEIVFLDEKKREILTATGVEAFTGEERTLVERALTERYHLSHILRVHRIELKFGIRYWNVDTNRGPRWFALRELGKNVTWLSNNRLVLRDTAGNRYEILDLSMLDARSRRSIRLAL